MKSFQIIALGIIGFILVLSLWNLFYGKSRKSFAVLWVFVWCCAGGAIFIPDATTVIAKFLGIMRGADLVFYCAVLAGLIGFFLVYLKIKNLNRQITLLVRQIAISHLENETLENETLENKKLENKKLNN